MTMQVVNFRGGRVLLHEDEEGRVVVDVDYLGLETTISRSQVDNKAVVQMDSKAGQKESDLRVYLNSTTLYGDKLYDIDDIANGERSQSADLFSHPPKKEQ